MAAILRESRAVDANPKPTSPWLGGDQNGNWSDFYELLGLPCGFGETALIEAVADHLIDANRSVSANNSKVTHRIQEIARAKTTLTDAAEKARYDRLLSETSGSGESLKASVPPIATSSFTTPVLASDAPPILAMGAAENSPPNDPLASPKTLKNREMRESSNRQPRNRPPKLRGLITLGMASTMCTVAIGVALHATSHDSTLSHDAIASIAGMAPTTSNDSNRDSSDTGRQPDASSPLPADPHELDDRISTAAPPDNIGVAVPWIENGPANSRISRAIAIDANAPNPDIRTPVDETTDADPDANERQVVSPVDVSALSESLLAARSALEQPDLASARRHIAAARRIARKPSHVDLVDRLDELTQYVDEFWLAFQDAMARIRPGKEIRVKNTYVNVVEVRPNSILIRVAGKNRRYNRDALPAGLVMAIVESSLNAQSASTAVIKGAIYAVHPEGDISRARSMWLEAQRRGADVSGLLPVLDDKYDLASLRNDP